MAIDNYVTALRNGQLELAKASGRTYGFHTTELASTGIAGQGTTNVLSGYNVDASTSGLTMKTPLAVPSSPVQGHVWQAGEQLLFRGSAASKTVFDLSTASQAIVAAKTLSAVLTVDSSGGVNANAAPDGTGLIIPASAGAPTGANTEGCLVFDTTNDVLYAGKGGTAWQALSSTALLPVSTQAGSILIGDGAAGWAEEKDVTVSSAGLITVGATGGLDFNGVNVDIDNSGTFDVLSAGVFSIDGTGASNVSATSGNLTLSTITSGSLIGTSATDIDLNAATDVTVDCTSGGISLDSTTASNFTVTGAADLTLSSTLGSTILASGESAADAVRINATGANGGIDIDALLGGVAIDTTAGISLDADTASNFTVTTGNLTLATVTSGNLTLSTTTAGDILLSGAAEIDLTSAGLVDVNAGANLDIDVTGTFDMLSTGAFSIDGTGASKVSATSGNLTLSTVTAGDVLVSSAAEIDLTAVTLVDINAATCEIDTTGILELNSSGGIISIGNDAVAQNINIGTGAAARKVTVGNATGATEVEINTGTVGLDVNSLGPVEIDGTGISIDGSLSSNVSVTGAQLQLSTITSGELDITSAALLDLNAATCEIDTTGILELNSSGGVIGIGNDAVAQAINIGTGAAARTITIGNATGATALVFNTGTGGTTFNIPDNDSSAFLVQQGANNYLGVVTTDGSEKIDFGNATTNPDYNFLGTGLLTVGASKLTVDGSTGDTVIAGNLTVTGTMFIADTQQVLIEDNNLYLNCTDVTPGTGTGGITVNYQPTATSDIVAATGFVAHSGAANAYVHTTGAATFGVGAFIQITGANNAANKGLFEVLSHAANVLTIRGLGTTACQEDFTQNEFVTDTTATGTITQVNVSVIRAGTDGAWEVAKGSSSPAGTPLTFTDLVTSTSGLTLQAAYEGGNTITTSSGEGNLTFAGTEDLIITLDNIDLDPTGHVTLDMATQKNITITMGDESAFVVRDETTTEILTITRDTGATPTTSVELDAGSIYLVESSSQLNSIRIDDGGVVVSIDSNATDEFSVLLDDGATSTAPFGVDADRVHIGNLFNDAYYIAAHSPVMFSRNDTAAPTLPSSVGDLVQDGYGTHVVCYAPTAKSTTKAQGVAFLTSGEFEVSGVSGDVDQSIVGKLVRGVAQDTVAATNYVLVQIAGIAEVEADTDTTTYDEGDLVKWNKAGKVTMSSKALGNTYHEELAGVVVSMKNRAGETYDGSTKTKIQIMLMNPVATTYIPA